MSQSKHEDVAGGDNCELPILQAVLPTFFNKRPGPDNIAYLLSRSR